MAKVYRQPAAQEDLIEHAVYLAIEAGQGTADRFFERSEKSFALLAGQPQMGAPLTFKDARFEGLRKWSSSGFENYMIFYLPRPMELLSSACFMGRATGGTCLASRRNNNEE